MSNILNLSINKENNPEFFSLLDRQNSLIDEWNRISREMTKLKIPKLLFFINWKKLKVISNDLDKLQKDFISWDNEAYAFGLNPILTFPNSSDFTIQFLHYSSVLRDMRNKLDNHMMLIIDNYNSIKEWHSNKTNFIIAIGSFILTFIGLIITLIALNH